MFDIAALMKIKPSQFRHLVIANVSDLNLLGYQPDNALENEFIVELSKQLADGVWSRIRFQLLPWWELQAFNVYVLRRRTSSPLDYANPYAPVILDLQNLSSLLAGGNIFPPDNFMWEFADKVSLISEITKAQASIIKFGIPWIEDPKSNVAKIRKLMKK